MFTREVPYTFLRKCSEDWSTKTTGHAAGDPTLIILTELFDGELLPVEFLHFNTHGNQREIELADGGLPAWKLLRQGLPSRPFVFNNSCLSRIGVSREFIRAGARGYIGTLWPVDAEQAARLATAVLERITRRGAADSAAGERGGCCGTA